jgi:hypothetical protein
VGQLEKYCPRGLRDNEIGKGSSYITPPSELDDQEFVLEFGNGDFVFSFAMVWNRRRMLTPPSSLSLSSCDP